MADPNRRDHGIALAAGILAPIPGIALIVASIALRWPTLIGITGQLLLFAGIVIPFIWFPTWWMRRKEKNRG